MSRIDWPGLLRAGLYELRLTPEAFWRLTPIELKIMLGAENTAPALTRARQIFFDAEMPQFQVVIPSFGIVQGAFQITAIEYAGTYNGEATYDMSLASAGSLTFTAI